MFEKKKKNKQTKQNQSVYDARVRYSFAVEEYLENNRVSFLEAWANICAKTSGRVSYDELEEVLGKDFPKAPWLASDDRDGNIRAFFAELRLPCKADETHIYFP